MGLSIRLQPVCICQLNHTWKAAAWSLLQQPFKTCRWHHLERYLLCSCFPGLRARMGAGFNRMNDLVIVQTSQVLLRRALWSFDVNALRLQMLKLRSFFHLAKEQNDYYCTEIHRQKTKKTHTHTHAILKSKILRNQRLTLMHNSRKCGEAKWNI